MVHKLTVSDAIEIPRQMVAQLLTHKVTLMSIYWVGFNYTPGVVKGYNTNPRTETSSTPFTIQHH